MYQVLDNGESATAPIGTEWQNCFFDTLDEAVDYAYRWLDYEFQPTDKEREALIRGEVVEYSGYGDTIQIVKVQR